jgi:hypothetical protein
MYRVAEGGHTVLPRFEDLNDAEREWLASCMRHTEQLVAAYSPTDSCLPFDPHVLDRTYAAWLATGEMDAGRINQVINSIGSSFGQLLVDSAGFNWVVATDQHGTDMALLALAGKGDVLVYPTHMIAKRWQTRETGFLAPLFEVVTKQVRDVASHWPDLPPQFHNG